MELREELVKYLAGLPILELAFEELANTEVTAEAAARDIGSAKAVAAIRKDIQKILDNNPEDET